MIRTLLVLGLLLGVAKGAWAGAIAYSFTELFDFKISSGINGNLMPAPSVDGFSSRASTAAKLNSVGPFDFVVRRRDDQPPYDVQVACTGPGCNNVTENNFAAIGPHAIKADSIVDSTDATTGARMRSDAAIALSTTDSGFGASSIVLFFNFGLAQADQVTVSFAAKPALKAMLHDNGRGAAKAGLDVRVRLERLVPVRGVVKYMDWFPDGTVNDEITGGTELADDTSLSHSITEDRAGQSMTYDPAGVLGGVAQNRNCSVARGCLFQVKSEELGANEHYYVALEVSNSVEAAVRKVPEPASMLLLVIGLVLAAAPARTR